MHVYLSTDPYGNVFTKRPEDAKLPHFVWHDITFGDWSEARATEYDVDIPEVSQKVVNGEHLTEPLQSVQHNGSLWADIILTMNDAHPDPSHPDYNQTSVHHIRKRK
jgi:Cleft lip and palate transmembrane protein 1 (CLPTM1)